MKISVDFDGTLDREDVQQWVSSLDAEVWICTARVGGNYEYNGVMYDNSDLYRVANRLGIPEERIIFTCYNDKSAYLDSSFAIHIDDNDMVLAEIAYNTAIKTISVRDKNWKEQINEI